MDVADEIHDVGDIDSVALHKLNAEVHIVQNRDCLLYTSYEFKNYILGMIFYYYLSDKTEKYMVNLLKDDGISYEERCV